MKNMNSVIVFGGGCFWCTETVFKMLKGVISVEPGYAAGITENPTYEEVCGGKTGHAEVVKIEFSPDEISFKDLLTVFFAMHDSTTLNRQGNDIGAQYRSIILYTSQEQKKETEDFIKELGRGVVTEAKPLDKFYPAEKYHRDYYEKNKKAPYCQIVISPKIEKLKNKFNELLKNAAK